MEIAIKVLKMTRKPVARGFYPFDKEELERNIGEMLQRVPEKSVNPKGLIVPHAGYRFSGKTAAHAYKTLENKEVKTAVILGFNHTGIGERSALSTQNWETPLGEVKVNEEISEKLLKNPLIKKDDSAHQREHSIEVQIPFLKYLIPDMQIIPISLSNQLKEKEIREIARNLRAIDYEENIMIISSDLHHVGARFGLTPQKDNLKYLKEQDEKFIEKIKTKDIQEIIEKGKKSTVCGFIPIAVALETLKEKIKGVKVLHRSNSYEVTGDKSSVVGYASIALY